MCLVHSEKRYVQLLQKADRGGGRQSLRRNIKQLDVAIQASASDGRAFFFGERAVEKRRGNAIGRE